MQTAVSRYETLPSDSNLRVKVFAPYRTGYSKYAKERSAILFNSIFTNDVFAGMDSSLVSLLTKKNFRVATVSWEGELNEKSRKATTDTYSDDVNQTYENVKNVLGVDKIDLTVSFSSSLPFVLLSAQKNGIGSENICTIGAMYKFRGRKWVEACNGRLMGYIETAIEKARRAGELDGSYLDKAFGFMDGEFGTIQDALSPKMGHPSMPTEVYSGYHEKFMVNDELTDLDVRDFGFEKTVSLNGAEDYLTEGHNSIKPLIRKLPTRSESRKMILADGLGHRKLLFESAAACHEEALKFLFKD